MQAKMLLLGCALPLKRNSNLTPSSKLESFGFVTLHLYYKFEQTIFSINSLFIECAKCGCLLDSAKPRKNTHKQGDRCAIEKHNTFSQKTSCAEICLDELHYFFRKKKVDEHFCIVILESNPIVYSY